MDGWIERKKDREINKQIVRSIYSEKQKHYSIMQCLCSEIQWAPLELVGAYIHTSYCLTIAIIVCIV